MNFGKQLKEGLITQNPVLVQVLGTVSYTHLDVYKRQDQVIKLKALEALEKMADGKATKLIIPSEIQGLAGLAASAKAILDDKPEA